MAHGTNLTFAAYLDQVRRQSTTRNGISGAKLHYYQFEELQEKLGKLAEHAGLSASGRMMRAFPNLRHLWLTRGDKARQAISFYRAAMTQRWWQIDGVGPTDATPAQPAYDALAIHRFERTLEKHERLWRSYFAENAIDPLVVRFEDLVADYSGQIVRVLTWLGISQPESVRLPPSRLKRQSDGLTEEWVERYKLERHLDDKPNPPTTPLTAPLRGPEPGLAWRQWIVDQKSRRVADEATVEVLRANGIPPDVASREVTRAANEPFAQAAVQRRQHERKPSALLDILGRLRRLDSRAGKVDVRTNLSPSAFRDEYYAANRPVIVRGLMTDWAAPSEWTPDYLKREVGDLVVEIMTDRDADPLYERNANRHRATVRFADYVDKTFSGVATNDYNLVANNGFFQRFSTHALLRDLEPRAPYLRPVESGQQCFLWFGPAGTVTPLHHDTSNILVANIRGRKRYRLIAPSQWRCVYNETGVFCDVDPEAPDEARYPMFRDAVVADVVLLPGEMLFMPVGWFHHARALDVSISVSFTNFVHSNHFDWEAAP